MDMYMHYRYMCMCICIGTCAGMCLCKYAKRAYSQRVGLWMSFAGVWDETGVVKWHVSLHLPLSGPLLLRYSACRGVFAWAWKWSGTCMEKTGTSMPLSSRAGSRSSEALLQDVAHLPDLGSRKTLNLDQGLSADLQAEKDVQHTKAEPFPRIPLDGNGP